MLKEEIDFPDGEAGFIKLYHDNNRLRYCNGTYYKLKDKKDQEKYNLFLEKYDTINNYYGNGIVD